ncbi:DJ-1/PfpI family protein [Kordiimonas pumila]|uniref:DJ-1/PfpI family protein n=1 Tax=Kordiimonas pumila TaxID=2161677 RepID=A0ABV7D5S8_9PROT|nr:DJ-1/PfpI family protein [Kordiimonas pumila]
MTKNSDLEKFIEAIDRRKLLQTFGAGLVASAVAGSSPAGAHEVNPKTSKPVMRDRFPGKDPVVAMLIYPKMVLLDLVGPLTVLNILGCEIHLVWKDMTPVKTVEGIDIAPTMTLDGCPKDVDVLFVPGGTVGTINCMKDDDIIAFMADRGSRAKYVTSVCTGSLVLAAAGLLRGYKATSLWVVADLLSIMGATHVPHERVVIDRNRMTGGGVTAGIDFGLVIGAALRGEEEAKRAQLIIEYDPAPPFNAGSPEGAGEEMASAVKAARTGLDGMVREAALKAAENFS